MAVPLSEVETESAVQPRVSFVQDWDFAQTLGEGRYGEVSLLLNNKTGESVACKVVNFLNNNPISEKEVQKEISILKLLKGNPHVIQYYGDRKHENIHYIFLEYAAGGELYDRIEPDMGMAQYFAQSYFKQLLSGLSYIHSRGIVHRDLKPENLLLDHMNQLKISDFGLATAFLLKGKRRRVSKCCGTMAYVAPEIFQYSSFEPEPLDIWSTGVILVAMLSGQLPWTTPQSVDEGYNSWSCNKITVDPWKRIDNVALSLLRKVLHSNPDMRATLHVIKCHPWFTKSFPVPESDYWDGNIEPLPKRRRILGVSGQMKDSLGSSQPILLDCTLSTSTDNLVVAAVDDSIASFSQPAQLENMFLSQITQNSASQRSARNILRGLVKRLTRFFLCADEETARKLIVEACERLQFTCKSTRSLRSSTGQISISNRENSLVFKCSMHMMDESVLADFRLSKGDGLEFKRIFRRLRNILAQHICLESVDWTQFQPNIIVPKKTGALETSFEDLTVTTTSGVGTNHQPSCSTES